MLGRALWLHRTHIVRAPLLAGFFSHANQQQGLTSWPQARVTAMATDGQKEHVIGEKEVLGKSRWLQLVNVKYDRAGQERTWQYCERTTTSATAEADAVVVFAIVKKPDEKPKVVVVKQFRPPLNKYTIELCAGLVDEGETVEEAALREFKEETGLQGHVLFTGGKQYMSPGLTNECVKTVFLEVDASNQSLQDPEDASFITIDYLPIDGLLESLEKLEAEGYGVWSGLYSIAQTLKLQALGVV
mmetsp:Transcript_44379/g.112285  ORF Transcript_44379/g.112285 Transcript_44379/m.112285 type:complete len:244 (+) Transcript_44379:96-827(+)